MIRGATNVRVRVCVAALADAEPSRDLFGRLMVWGLSMTLVGALLCPLLPEPFARF
jgi:hypothetical protein